MPRPTFQDYLWKFGLVLLIALIFTAADAFSYDGASAPATMMEQPRAN